MKNKKKSTLLILQCISYSTSDEYGGCCHMLLKFTNTSCMKIEPPKF